MPKSTDGNLRLLILAFALVAIAAPALAGGGWVRPPGTAYLSLRYSSLESTEYYSLSGQLRNRGSLYSARSADLYGEYGLTRHLTGIVAVPLVKRLAFKATESTLGFGDLGVGLKYGTVLRGFHVAGSASAELPTGREEAYAKLLSDPESRVNLPPGDGELNVWLRLASSRSHPVLPVYASLDGGYNLRTEGFSDQYDFNFDAGYRIMEPLWIRAKIRGLYSVADNPDPTKSFVYGEGTEYMEWGAGSELRVVGPWALVFDYSNVFAHRRNVYGGSRFSGGIAAQL